MNITDLPIDQLKEARWNPNVMNEAMLMRLRESISRFGPRLEPGGPNTGR